MAADHSTNASAGTPQSGPQAMSTGAGKRGPAKRGSKGKAKTAAQTPPSARQEAVRTSMVKRKEWEDEVFRAMECAFDRAVSAADLRKWAAKYFEQRHYSDIVEERIANNLCGYPLCSNPVQKLNGKYRISFSQKQVYDISDLKKFCSKECMAASRYTISQLSLDPGYMRDIEQVFEVLDILDMDSLASIRLHLENKADSVSNAALVESHIKNLLSQTPKPPPTPFVDELLLDPNAIMITERPVTPSDFEAALNAAPRSDAELIEGFRVTPRGRAITDMLAEYEDRRKGLEAQEVTHTSQLQSNPVGSTGQSKVTTAKWDKNAEPPTSLTKSTPSQESKQRKSVVWADEKSKPLEESAEPHASDEENDPDSWLLPSSKSVAKAVQRNTLSLFGRIWTILMGIATSETFKFVQKGPGSIDTDALFEGLFHAGVDMDAVVLRAKIFSEKVLKCCVSFCKRYQVKSSIRDDMIVFLSTMYVRESSVVLHTIEERVISFIFLKVVADTVGGSLKEEIANRVTVDTVVRNETGGAITLVEVEAIARGVFYT